MLHLIFCILHLAKSAKIMKQCKIHEKNKKNMNKHKLHEKNNEKTTPKIHIYFLRNTEVRARKCKTNVNKQ